MKTDDSSYCYHSKHHNCTYCDCLYTNYLSKFYKLFYTFLSKSPSEIKEVLLPFINKKIQIIIPASPPAAKPPNITGTLIYIDDTIIKLKLNMESKESTKIGIYLLDSILGFIPLNDKDNGGCEKETNPLTTVISQYLGKRIQLSLINGSTAKGVVLDITNDFVNIQLDQTEPTTTPLVATYTLSQVSSVVDLSPSIKSHSSKGQGHGKNGQGSSGKHSSEVSKGSITVQVSVIWEDNNEHPNDIDVNFIRDGIITTIHTINGVATFSCEPSGNLVIQGQDIPGFITPYKEIKLPGNVSFIIETLIYASASISVTGITLYPSDLGLIVSDSYKLKAQVLPLNANNQDVLWESLNVNIASVDSTGIVTAHEQGDTTINASSAESPYLAQTNVSVLTITNIVPIPSIEAILGEVILLPTTANVVRSDSYIVPMPVTWKLNDSYVETTFKVPSDATGNFTLTGVVDKTNLLATLTILVDTSQTAIPVTGLTLNILSDSIYVGDSIKLIPTIEQDNATIKDVVFSSSDTSVATVSSSGTITGISPDFATIEVTTVDGNFKAYCIISVSSVPEIDLIYSVENVYSSYEDVVINVENLVADRIFSPTKYYIKIEKTGSNPLVGTGSVILQPDATTFMPYFFTTFTATPNYNNQYFFYMSTDPSFPKSDEQTLSTNFKIGSAVPTFNPNDIHVDLTIIGGDLDNNPSDITFILAREIDLPINEITWKNYILDLTAEDIQFTDEVKLKGKCNSEGVVIWEKPKETLKLGGYILLEVTPDGYIDNLNLINPDGDGGLLKEVQLTRDNIIVRHVVNTPL